MNERVLDLADETATQEFGARLAAVLQPPLMVALEGDLGAGKTSLARALIQTLLPNARVKSPTYTLVESYAVPCGHIHQFDLYRVVDPDELEQIDLSGFADAQSVLLIEWPDKGGDRTASPDVRVQLQYLGTGRQALIRGETAAGEAVVAELAEKVS